MLNGLDAVAWATLGHAYGSADDVPDLLREAASEDQERREEAVHELFGTVWHQGTVYSATPHAVPFIAELAADGPGHRGDMLQLLACIVEGGDHSGGDTEAVGAARRAVFALLPDLLQLACDTDRKVRKAWLRLIAACGPDAGCALPLLDERLRSEPDSGVRADVVTVLCTVDPSAAGAAERLGRLVQDPVQEVRFAALTEILRGSPMPFPEVLVAQAVDTRIALPRSPELGWPEDHAAFEDLLVEDPDAALFATARAAAAGSRWSLAWSVDETWRDREADVLPLYFEDLRAQDDDPQKARVLAQIARAAAAVPALAAPHLEALAAYAADDRSAAVQTAAVSALARAGSVDAVERCVHLVRNAPGDYGTGLAVAATVDAFGDRAEPVAQAVAERLRDLASRPAPGGANQDIAMMLALEAFPELAETLVGDLTDLMKAHYCPNAAVLLLGSLGPRAHAAAPALLDVARGSDETFLNLAAATAYFRITGDPAVALDLFGRTLDDRHARRVFGRVGVLGAAALPLLPRLEAGLEAGIGWARVGAAESIWRLTGRVEDTLPRIAAEARTPDAHFHGAAQTNAVRVLTEMRLVPEALLPSLRAFADSPRRLVFDGSHDGTPHDDNTARTAVRHLLDTADISPLPVAPPVPDNHGWGPL